MATDDSFLSEVAAFLGSEDLPGIATPKITECSASFLTSEPWSCHATSTTAEGEIGSGSDANDSGDLDKVTATTKHKGGDRRSRYRQRMKGEREELCKMEKQLSRQLRDLKGRETSAREDVTLSQSFWRSVAIRQRGLRQKAEADQKRLVTTISSQAEYIAHMCQILRDQPRDPSARANERDDSSKEYRWLQLKSSDSAVYTAYLQDVDDCYAQVDEVFDECGMDSTPDGMTYSAHYRKTDGRMEYCQVLRKVSLPFSFAQTCQSIWELGMLSHQNFDREVLQGMPENTVAFKFRQIRTLTCGTVVSVLKRIVARRFIEESREVMVWKTFMEGEGVFSGIDTEEIAWVSVRKPTDDDAPKTGAISEVCVRQMPTPFLPASVKDIDVDKFREMLQDTIKEDNEEFASTLNKLLALTV